MARRRTGKHLETTPDAFEDPGPGEPGRTRDGAPSPLIRTRAQDFAFVLGSQPARAILVLVLIGTLAWAGYSYAWPAAHSWWERTTNPPQPDPTTSISYIETDGTPVLYGLEPVTLTAGDPFDPTAGVRALDVEDGDLTAAITITGQVDTATPGTYELTYAVTDSFGNRAAAVRTVTVNPAPLPPPTDPPATQAPQPPATPKPTQPPAPKPTQPPATQPPAPPVVSRASKSLTVTCTGPGNVTVTATGGGNVQLSGAASGSGGTSLTKTVHTEGGSLSFTAMADGTVHISWSSDVTCS